MDLIERPTTASSAKQPIGLFPYYRPPRLIGNRKPVEILVGNKGNLALALASAEALDNAWPTTPQSDILLRYMHVKGNVTAADLAFFDLCLAYAREPETKDKRPITEQIQDALNRKSYKFPIEEAICLLGWQRKQDYILASLNRLSSAKVDVDMDPRLRRRLRMEDRGPEPLLRWHLKDNGNTTYIHYRIPELVRRILLYPFRYRQVELGAIASMGSRYSVAVYKRLLMKTWRKDIDPRPGSRTDHQEYFHQVRPMDLARQIGWPHLGGTFEFGIFKREVLDRLKSDLAHVRGFKTTVSLLRGSGRGRPVERIQFWMSPAVPDWRTVRVPTADEQTRMILGLPDLPGRQIEIGVYLRAQSCFGVSAIELRKAWQRALFEADISTPFNDDYDMRQYRGGRLLKLIRDRDPNDVFWDFCVEEVKHPSLLIEGADSVDDTEIERARYHAVNRARMSAEKCSSYEQRLTRRLAKARASHETVVIYLDGTRAIADIVGVLQAMKQVQAIPPRPLLIVTASCETIDPGQQVTVDAGTIQEFRDLPGVEGASIAPETIQNVIEEYRGMRECQAMAARLGNNGEIWLDDIKDILSDIDQALDGRLFSGFDRAARTGDLAAYQRIVLDVVHRRAAKLRDNVIREVAPVFDKISTFFARKEKYLLEKGRSIDI